MKKIFKYAMLFAMVCSLTTAMTSCSVMMMTPHKPAS